MVKYTKIEGEDEIEKPKDLTIGNWPEKGGIEFQNVTMRYRASLEPSVRNLTFSVEPGMKVGIVGRTGAGKSSIL